jgi:S-methylmethionine-dependent homocysteine/selenocysteine methylase
LSYKLVKEKLGRGETVLLDGGVATEILRRGVYWRSHGIEQHPEIVRQVHADYLAAGADVLRTNTFQLNRRAYLNLFHGLEHMRHIGPPGLEDKAGRLLRRAVELAREARRLAGRESEGVAIAGVVSPLEHCFRPDLTPPLDQCRAEYREIIEELKNGGADFILLESMNRVAEARVACEVAQTSGLPVWVSFVVREDARLLSNESLPEALEAVEPLGADVVLINCAPLEDVTAALRELSRRRKGAIGAYAHIGRYDPPSWKFGFYPRFTSTDSVPPARYLEVAREWKRTGAQVIGGCCGTTPEHIQALREGLTRESQSTKAGSSTGTKR